VENGKKIVTDSLGFLGIPGGSIVVDPNLNLDLVHLTAAPPWADTMKKVVIEIRKFRDEIKKQDKLRILSCGNDLCDTPDGVTDVVLGLQHLPKDVDVKLLRELGIRIVIPSYVGWKTDSGLTNGGRELIMECNDNGICIDTSHTGHKTAKEILDFAKMAEIKIPVIASHTGCNSVYKNGRNLPNNVLKQIAEQGGIVGIYAMSFFLDKNSKSIDPIGHHLLYALHLCGTDSVCFGGDIPYLNRDEEEWQESFKKLQKMLDPDGKMGSSWPEYPKDLNCVDRTSVLKDILSVVTTGVKGPEIIEKVIGKNFYRFVKENL
jgi:microsomal dipeptidase-like Zn-dependent dipeptidase